MNEHGACSDCARHLVIVASGEHVCAIGLPFGKSTCKHREQSEPSRVGMTTALRLALEFPGEILEHIRAAGLDPEYAELVRLREAVSVAEKALTELSRWREASHEYDDDVSGERRVFDEEDLGLAEAYAAGQLEAICELVKP